MLLIEAAGKSRPVDTGITTQSGNFTFANWNGSAIVNQFLETFKEFPPRQEPATFTINHAVEELNKFLASRGG